MSEYIGTVDSQVDSNLEHLPEYASLHRDGSSWFVKSECFNYAAGGDTVRQAIDYFWNGFLETILYHLQTHSNIDALVTVWDLDEC